MDWTPLHEAMALKSNSADAVIGLRLFGADPTLRDTARATSLHYAAGQGMDRCAAVQIVTTQTVPSKQRTAIESPDRGIPVMVLPTSEDLGGRTLADGATRGM